MRLYSYQSCNELLTGRNRDSRKLCNNTYLHRIDAEAIGVKLHSTDVIVYHSDGRITFNSGGWHTVTTKARMNEYSPAQVWSKRGKWLISMGGTTAGYVDGITGITTDFVDGIAWSGWWYRPEESEAA